LALVKHLGCGSAAFWASATVTLEPVSGISQGQSWCTAIESDHVFTGHDNELWWMPLRDFQAGTIPTESLHTAAMPGEVYAVAVDGDMVVAGCPTGDAVTFNVQTGERGHKVHVGGDVYGVAITPHHFAVNGFDNGSVAVRAALSQRRGWLTRAR
jgi:hypothetical protein